MMLKAMAGMRESGGKNECNIQSKIKTVENKPDSNRKRTAKCQIKRQNQKHRHLAKNQSDMHSYTFNKSEMKIGRTH